MMPQSLVDMIKAEGFTKFTLHFQGGSDEGYLDIKFECPTGGGTVTGLASPTKSLEEAVEDWAWSVYEYSGGGDGSDYGDEYTYNLEKMTITHKEWYMAKTYKDGTKSLEFEIEKDDEFEIEEEE